jgi:CubicO group peptidase (beta-lactamase class C family)
MRKPKDKMTFPEADWETAAPESEGIKAEKLAEAIAFMDRNFYPEGAKELVIIRNGYLVWAGPDCDAYHELYSVTKAFTSTVLGLLLEEGKLTLDTHAVDIIPGLDIQYPDYKAITIRHLATSTAGYYGMIMHTGVGQFWGDPVVYVTIPGNPEFTPPGSQASYNDHNTQLLGRILAHVAQEPLKDYFETHIARKIGLTRWEWGICGTVDGITFYNAAGTPTIEGNGGVRTSPRYLARLGLLYLNEGNWKGQQLVPSSYIQEATSNQIPVTMRGRSCYLMSGAYGFYWWTNGVMASGNRRWPGAPPGTYCAAGTTTNYCFVIPEWDMVIARTGKSAVELPNEGEELWSEFFTMIAEAVT